MKDNGNIFSKKKHECQYAKQWKLVSIKNQDVIMKFNIISLKKIVKMLLEKTMGTFFSINEDVTIQDNGNTFSYEKYQNVTLNCEYVSIINDGISFQQKSSVLL